MRLGKEVYRNVKLTEDVKTMSLSLSNQIRIMASKVSNNDLAELEAEELVNVDYLTKMSALNSFLDKATAKMRDKGCTSVTVLLPSVFIPCLEEVINPQTGKGRFYDFDIYKQDSPLDIVNNLIVRVKAKEG